MLISRTVQIDSEVGGLGLCLPRRESAAMTHSLVSSVSTEKVGLSLRIRTGQFFYYSQPVMIVVLCLFSISLQKGLENYNKKCVFSYTHN